MVWHEIFLKRQTLTDLPQCEMQRPFSLRPYHFGDEENWYDIYKSADDYNRIYSSTFREYFNAGPEQLQQRQFYLCDGEDKAIGTASAWYNDSYHGERWGRVHWVAIRPEYQGYGLARPLLCAVLQRLADCGHDKAYLRTISVRIPAINLYFSVGFEPDIRNEIDRKIWQGIACHMSNHPVLKRLGLTES